MDQLITEEAEHEEQEQDAAPQETVEDGQDP